MTGNCKKTCASDDLDCYLLDNNGFVLLSEKTEHTGKFFGQIDGTIMDSLVQDRIYRRIPLMDYQGICSDKDNPYRAAGHILRPPTPLGWFFKFLATYFMTWLSFLPPTINAWPHNYEDNYEYPVPVNYDEQYEDQYNFGADETPTPIIPTQDRYITPQPPKSTSTNAGPRVVPDPAHARSCDLSTDLYLLQPERLNQSGQNNPLKVF